MFFQIHKKMSWWNNFFRGKRQKMPNRSLEDIKNGCRVLFIDDQKFKLVDRLRDKDGWKNTVWIKDVDSLSQMEVLDAHIIFVDIQGVGTKMGYSDAGLGLIVSIKKQYPNKKVVMYSAESQGKIDSFHNAANLVDYRIRKTADQYEFSSIIEHLAKEAFCLENCIVRIKRILYNEYNISMSENEIERKLNKIYPKDFTEDRLASAFNIQNAASIASILQLFTSM